MGYAFREMVADVKNKKTGVTGLKLLTSVQGDFTLELDFECKKLDRPSSGWGQGLVIRLLTDDPDTPVIAIGCVVRTGARLRPGGNNANALHDG